MTKNELTQKTDKVISETQYALQMVYDTLNYGQQQKLLNDSEIVALFERYGVVTEQ